MEEKEQLDFTLEDILREFGNGSDDDVTEAPAVEEPAEVEEIPTETETTEEPVDDMIIEPMTGGEERNEIGGGHIDE